jgi:hypothetical protein
VTLCVELIEDTAKLLYSLLEVMFGKSWRLTPLNVKLSTGETAVLCRSPKPNQKRDALNSNERE